MKKYTIGVDLGGTNVAVGIVDQQRNIIIKGSTPTQLDKRFETVMKDMGALINKLLKENNISLDECKYIGIGSPGQPNNTTGIMSDNSNLHWTRVPMRTELQKYVDLPVYMDNDANVAAWAEYLEGCGRGTTNFVAVTLGTGVGGGIIINKALYSGSHGIGAEIGHMILVKDGYICGCGNKGCAEKYCSATAIIYKTKELLATGKYNDSVLASTEKITAKSVIDASKSGDKLGVLVFDWYVDSLAHLVISIINVLDPDVIALGGGVANAGDYLLKPLLKEIDKHIMYIDTPYAEVKIAQMGNDAGILGAALLGE